jgi:hypothetical protein
MRLISITTADGRLILIRVTTARPIAAFAKSPGKKAKGKARVKVGRTVAGKPHDESKHPRGEGGRFKDVPGKGNDVLVRGPTRSEALEAARALALRRSEGGPNPPANAAPNSAGPTSSPSPISGLKPTTPMMTRAIEIAAKHGVTVEILPAKYFRKDVPAKFSSDTEKVYINKDAPVWKKKNVSHFGAWLSSASPDHLIHHEIGHARHYRAVGSERFQEMHAPVDESMRAKIGLQVSTYGKTNQVEFVAEVYAASAGGRKFSDEIIQYYKKLGGVTP